MTRSDIINSLVGSRLSSRAIHFARSINQQPQQSQLGKVKKGTNGEDGDHTAMTVGEGTNTNTITNASENDDDDDEEEEVTATDDTDTGTEYEYEDDSSDGNIDDDDGNVGVLGIGIQKRKNGSGSGNGSNNNKYSATHNKLLQVESQPQNVNRIPCQADDIGGLYAALCSLGEEIEIGTKVSTSSTRMS